jgi:hypothetical protein
VATYIVGTDIERRTGIGRRVVAPGRRRRRGDHRLAR